MEGLSSIIIFFLVYVLWNGAKNVLKRQYCIFTMASHLRLQIAKITYLSRKYVRAALRYICVKNVFASVIALINSALSSSHI